jgi:hypothetical protein
MSTFTNGYRNTIKIEMNRSDKNRFKHFNFLVKFDLFFGVVFQKFNVKFDIVVFKFSFGKFG